MLQALGKGGDSGSVGGSLRTYNPRERERREGQVFRMSLSLYMKTMLMGFYFKDSLAFSWIMVVP
jgi:hypothetical protein